MDIDQLATFERIVREGSFSRAALALGLGQPAVSSRMQSLEAAVGGALLNRGRRTTLTALGEGFLPYARRILEMVGEGVEAARRTKEGRRGRVRLGALGSLAGGLVGPALADLVRERPELECSLKAADHEVVLEMLLDGVVELALVAWPPGERRLGSVSPVFTLREPVVLVAHPKHALARRRTATRRDLLRLGRPLLRLRWWPTLHPQIAALAQESGPSVEVPMETARHLVAQGAAVGFFTRTYVADALDRREMVEVRVRGLAPLYRDSALVRKSRWLPLSPAADALVDRLRAHASRLGLMKGNGPKG